MHSSPSLKTTRLVCLLIAVAGAACPLVSKADDAATANTPAATNMTVAATAPETTNTPEPATALETTNTPAPATAPETTNTSAVATAPETTNAPPPATALATTNPPVAATAPIITNLPAAVTVPAPAITPTNVTTMPATATPVTAPPKITQTPRAMTPPPYQPFNLGAEAGTTGFGGAAGWRFANHFGVVGGMDYLSYTLNRTINDVPYSAHLRLQSEYAALNLYPWRNSSFRLSLGAYFNQNRLAGSALSTGSLNVNGYPVPSGDTVRLEYKQQPVDPYASIGGNLYFDKARHFSLGAEIGAFYLGNPKVNVSTSPSGVVPQSDLDANQRKLARDLKKIPVWPIIKLSLNYSF
jgi:hypothetical protein